jgi:hypothetical protein
MKSLLWQQIKALVMNSRRLIGGFSKPPRAAVSRVYPRLTLPHRARQVLGPDLNRT